MLRQRLFVLLRIQGGLAYPRGLAGRTGPGSNQIGFFAMTELQALDYKDDVATPRSPEFPVNLLAYPAEDRFLAQPA